MSESLTKLLSFDPKRPDLVQASERSSEGRLSTSQRNEARIFALSIVRDAEYRRNLLQAARARNLPPAIEVVLLAYAYGRPTERVELGRPGAFDDLSTLSPQELAQRARLVSAAAAELHSSSPSEAEAQTDREVAFSSGEVARRSFYAAGRTAEEEALAEESLVDEEEGAK